MQPHAERPAESLDSHSINLRTQQRTTERALRRLARLRKKAAGEIEKLLSFLDASDDYVTTELETDTDGGHDSEGDEDSDAELTLPVGDQINQDRAYGEHVRYHRYRPDPRAGDNEADRSDFEPSLGSSHNNHNQTHWADGAKDDREGGDEEIEGADEDSEASEHEVWRSQMPWL